MNEWLSSFFENVAGMIFDLFSQIWNVPLELLSDMAGDIGMVGPWAEAYQALDGLVGSGYLRWVDLVVPVEFAATCFVNYITLWVIIKGFVGGIRYIKGWV